ncbi:M4 family metallopeptidase [Tumebacillus sp. DT12]|uniref:Neutral metalloproteinase n=1 Tax=Tumebacillus lacus TaxID=2995335 RepID=A0ABT3WZ53_9BACL|nr:M4 family metallopeptidase [Tumebacillus lacus]MCX7568792.1 M4 family metallopeptidase [Tumebacillus lacus]
MNKKVITTLVLSSMVASALSMNAGAASDKQVLKNETGHVHNVVGKLGKVSGATADERALKALDKVKGDFGYAQANGHFKVTKSHKDDNGVSHTKLARVIDGIPVFGGEMIVHEKDGNVQGVTGSYKDLAPTAKKASLSSAEAIKKAVASTGFTGELTEEAQAKLVFVPKADKAVLSYEVSVRYMDETPGNWSIFVNAVDGSIVDSFNRVEYANHTLVKAKPGGGTTPTTGTAAVGTGTGVLGDTKTSLNTMLSNGTYYLQDKTKATSVQTYDYANSTSSKTLMSDIDNVWDTSVQRAGVDAHYYAGKVYDYYFNEHNRNSYNNNGATLVSGVHYSRSYNNAFWNGSQMTYGDGDGVTFIALSGAYDVVAHELTHAVTEYTSGLVYQNQSGALNESWSDAMAAVMDSDDWLIGEDVYTPGKAGDALRSMSNPSAYGDPEHMNQFVNTTSDNGGVHTNSGIPNKAFYNFATAIGSRSIAGKVWYTASRDYMTSSTNFSGARAATLQAVAALYGTSSSYYTALQTAWSNVGVN